MNLPSDKQISDWLMTVHPKHQRELLIQLIEHLIAEKDITWNNGDPVWDGEFKLIPAYFGSENFN